MGETRFAGSVPMYPTCRSSPHETLKTSFRCVGARLLFTNANSHPAQCAIPVFDGLLSEPYNGIILDLLFELATWHTFGKLRLHTETTLFHFENSTTRLGRALRKFSKDCCTQFKTCDLPRETAARVRRRGAKTARAPAATSSKTPKTVSDTIEAHKRHVFNMSTYKLHALGNYVKAIQHYGTTDNYST